ncbi:MAG: DUF1080 domain-containing protein [Gemmataceae bacterium]|nr:DUF1080 domain-containing protein [Gemmataceae bacterium]MDW8266912.1 DUF1080 domain-containing protein [Gemmataceae bacterium]
MRRGFRWGAAVGWALVLWGTGTGGGQAADDFRVEEGFVSLFNGKDLTGWVYPKKDGSSLDGKMETPDQRFQVADGVIVIRAKDKDGKGGIRDLYTSRSFDKDFDLKLEFRAAPRADSGVYIRGTQLQVRDYPTVGPYKDLTKFKPGDWNELEISVRGTEATCRCNGELLGKGPMKVPAKGGIGLQAESGQFEFRRIRIRELP